MHKLVGEIILSMLKHYSFTFTIFTGLSKKFMFYCRDIIRDENLATWPSKVRPFVALESVSLLVK